MTQPTDELKSYIESEVFPRYSQNDPGHDLSHIQSVIARSFALAAHHHLTRLNPDFIYAAAAYHDIGCSVDRSRHEQISAEMFLVDSFMRDYFAPGQRTTISRAIADHRASLGHPPRNVYGRLLSSADRTIDIDNGLRRVYLWKLPELGDPDTIAEFSYAHAVKKFGHEGYAKGAIYFSDGKYEKYLKELQSLLTDKSAYIARLRRANNLE